MTELTKADLKDFPDSYQSNRGLWDILIGEDTALPLMEASSSGDVDTLRGLLSQPQWVSIALEEPHTIYHADQPPKDNTDAKYRVLAMKLSNIVRGMIKATIWNHAEIVSTWLEFAQQQGVKASSLIHYWLVKTAIKAGHASIFDALAAAHPTVVNFDLHYDGQPLDFALQQKQTDVVATLLRLGASVKPSRFSIKRHGTYRRSLLSIAAGSPRLTELFLEYGHTVEGTGALHNAAEMGRLDTMRLLIEHGVDVNERLPEDTKLAGKRAYYACWTPMHFAAKRGQSEAIELLKSYGARSDEEDLERTTPDMLMKEFEENQKSSQSGAAE